MKRDHLAGVNESLPHHQQGGGETPPPCRQGQGESKKQNNRRETPAAETLFFASQNDLTFFETILLNKSSWEWLKWLKQDAKPSHSPSRSSTDATRASIAAGPVKLNASDAAVFNRDSVQQRATWRIGYKPIHADRLVKITVTADAGK